MNRDGNKRRMPRSDPEPPSKNTPPPSQPTAATSTRTPAENDDKPIPDDLSEISDDPDDILNREDVRLNLNVIDWLLKVTTKKKISPGFFQMADQTMDEDSQSAAPADDSASKAEGSEKDSTQV